MRGMLACFAFVAAVVFAPAVAHAAQEGRTLQISDPAPDFTLPGVVIEQNAGPGQPRTTAVRHFTLKDFADANVLMVVFIANHCPVATAYEDRINQIAQDYRGRGVAVVAVSPNAHPSLKEGEPVSDRGDSLEEMKVRAIKKNFSFPYLYDGDTQSLSRAFGPATTPHVFIFDKSRKLRYAGRIDNSQNPAKATEHDARNAIEALLAGKPVPVETTKPFGCSIKWRSDTGAASAVPLAGQKSAETSLKPAGEREIRALVRNESGRLRLINVWATWCGPCMQEFPELVSFYRNHQAKGVDLVLISADQPETRANVLKVLRRQQAPGDHYQFNASDMSKLVEAVDPQWQGAIPYTILVAPGGQVLYRSEGIFNPQKLGQAIEHHAAK